PRSRSCAAKGWPPRSIGRCSAAGTFVQSKARSFAARSPPENSDPAGCPTRSPAFANRTSLVCPVAKTMRGQALSSQATMQESAAAPTVRASSSQICSSFLICTVLIIRARAAAATCALERPISDRCAGRPFGSTLLDGQGVSMRQFVRRLLRSESGQGLSEYLIIVALVAVAAIGVLTVFGRDIRELFSGTTDSLAGNQATNTARKATVKAGKNLKTFGKYNASSGD